MREDKGQGPEEDDRPAIPYPFATRTVDDIYVYYEDILREQQIERDIATIDREERGYYEDKKVPLRKRGRPAKRESEKAQKITITIPPHIRKGLENIYGKKLGVSKMIQLALWEQISTRQRLSTQLKHLKGELRSIKKLLEATAKVHKEGEKEKLSQEIERQVKSFIRMVQFLGLVQRIPELSNPKETKTVDFLAMSLNESEKIIYKFCNDWGINNYGALL